MVELSNYSIGVVTDGTSSYFRVVRKGKQKPAIYNAETLKLVDLTNYEGLDAATLGDKASINLVDVLYTLSEDTDKPGVFAVTRARDMGVDGELESYLDNLTELDDLIYQLKTMRAAGISAESKIGKSLKLQLKKMNAAEASVKSIRDKGLNFQPEKMNAAKASVEAINKKILKLQLKKTKTAKASVEAIKDKILSKSNRELIDNDPRLRTHDYPGWVDASSKSPELILEHTDKLINSYRTDHFKKSIFDDFNHQLNLPHEGKKCPLFYKRDDPSRMVAITTENGHIVYGNVCRNCRGVGIKGAISIPKSKFYELYEPMFRFERENLKQLVAKNKRLKPVPKKKSSKKKLKIKRS